MVGLIVLVMKDRYRITHHLHIHIYVKQAECLSLVLRNRTLEHLSTTEKIDGKDGKEFKSLIPNTTWEMEFQDLDLVMSACIESTWRNNECPTMSYCPNCSQCKVKCQVSTRQAWLGRNRRQTSAHAHASCTFNASLKPSHKSIYGWQHIIDYFSLRSDMGAVVRRKRWQRVL